MSLIIKQDKNRTSTTNLESNDRSVLANRDSVVQLNFVISLSAIFVLALALRIWFNFFAPHINTYNACDAWEYLSNASAIDHLQSMGGAFLPSWLSCLLGTASVATHQQIAIQLKPLHDLSLSGPIYPLFLWLTFFLSGQPTDVTNWTVPIAAQIFLSALTCLNIATIANYAWNRKVAFCAGLIAAIYPGFIVSSGRLTTETFACFVLTLVMLLIAKGLSTSKSINQTLVATGTLFALLHLTRPILMLAVAFLFPLVLNQHGLRKKLVSVICITLGAAPIIAPWAAWQMVATGQPSLAMDRMGSYNLQIGSDVYSGGWATFPLQTIDADEKKNLVALVPELIMRNPVGFFKLQFDKLARLFKFPCNDFRANIGAITLAWQVLFHQVLLLLALSGLILGIFLNASSKVPPQKHQIWCRLSILGIILIHLAYTPFDSVARYALTAMPFVIMLSVAGLFGIINLAIQAQTRKFAITTLAATAITLTLLRENLIPYLAPIVGSHHISASLFISCIIKSAAYVALLALLWRSTHLLCGNRLAARLIAIISSAVILPVACWQLKAHGRWYEWECSLDKPADKISESIQLNGKLRQELQFRQCYLLIDADGWQQFFKTAEIKVNGQTLAAPIIPGLSLPDCIFWYVTDSSGKLVRNYENSFNSLAMRTGNTLPDLRQWFLLPLPLGCLNKDVIDVEIVQSAHCPIKLFGSYPIKNSALNIPNVYTYSWEKAFYSPENDGELSDTRTDDEIPRRTSPAHFADLSSSAGLQCGNFNIRLLAAPAAHISSTQFISPLETTHISAGNISTSSTNPFTMKLSTIPKYSSDISWSSPENLWLMRVSGKLRGSNNRATPSIGIRIHSTESSGKQHEYFSPWTPSLKCTNRDWVPFDFAFPVNPRAFPGRVSSVDIECYASNPVLTSVNPTMGMTTNAEFGNLTLEILNLPILPTARGYKVY